MPGPPPPPPPAGGLPPPPTFAPPAPSTKGGADQRDALLSAIRKGKSLKKAVTVDKSGPCIPGKVSNSSSSNNTSSINTNNDRPAPSGPPNGLVGLAALFPGGQIPKLRPVGGSNLPHNSNGHTSANQRSPDTAVLQKNFANTQHEIKKRMANDNRNRGPPPPAPSRTPSSDDTTPKKFPVPTRNGSANHMHLKPGSVSDLSSMGFEQNRSALHKRAVSNTNIGSAADSTDSVRNNLQPKPSYGKPNVAPKPPVLNGKVKPLNRTQSMKNPRSPSPQSPGSVEKNISNFGTVRSLKPELKDALANIHQAKPRPPMNDRPKGPPPSIPQPYSTPTPLAPSKSIKHPGHAPPPPPPSMVTAPNQPPPIPPHRSAPHVPPRTVPPPPPSVSSNGNGAPPPPPRIYSMKDNTLIRPVTSPSDFEARFEKRFHDMSTFPLPLQFKGVEKIYSGKQVGSKQPAPLPPNHILLNNNRLWESSTC